MEYRQRRDFVEAAPANRLRGGFQVPAHHGQKKLR
jgi:hypothetical protein